MLNWHRLVMRLSFLALVVGLTHSALAAETGFLNRVLKDDDGEHKYVVFVPKAYDASADKKWPVILYLHGASERGKDGLLQTKAGLGPIVQRQADRFPFIAVFPQCEDAKGPILECWTPKSPDGKRALKILETVEQDYKTDPNTRVLTGWSMGGYGTWAFGAAYPEKWSAVVPLAGGGDPETAAKLKETPVWAIHGADDKLVMSSESQKMVDALKDAGGNVQFDLIENEGHEVWKVAYSNSALFQWMLNPASVPVEHVALKVRPGDRPDIASIGNQPFVPALEIPRAAYVRLGNNMLDALATSIPQKIPREVLYGGIQNISDSTQVEGRSFSISFTGISYSTQVTRASIKAYRDNRLNIQLGLENAQLSIGRTYVQGEDHSAVAGPIGIGIGQRGPVWLSFDVEPYVENRKLRLRHVSTSFNIPQNNWYVSAPAGVTTRGFGMTEEKVSNGLVRGLYGSKWRIEREVSAIVPNLVRQLEEQFDFTLADGLVESLWPLPVYQPRLRVWPHEVSTDKDGVSMVVGVTAAAIDPKLAPQSPTRHDEIGLPVSSVPKGEELQIGIAPEILEPLTNMLIEADVARVHLSDIPDGLFNGLTDYQTLSDAIPDLKQFGDEAEIWSELVLAQPMAVEKPSESDSKQSLQFHVPKALISLAVRKSSVSLDWTPYAELSIDLTQGAEAAVIAPTMTERSLRFAWKGDPSLAINARFAPNYAPKQSNVDVEKLESLFRDGWSAWTQRGPASSRVVPDIDFGITRLRLSDLRWEPPYLNVDFVRPGIRITNNSEETLEYYVKSPTSAWGGPYQLLPEKTHNFEVAYDVIFRRTVGGRLEKFTLATGTHSEFRNPKDGGSPRLFQAREDIWRSALDE